MTPESRAEVICDLLRPIALRPWFPVSAEMALMIWNTHGESAAKAYIQNVLDNDPEVVSV